MSSSSGKRNKLGVTPTPKPNKGKIIQEMDKRIQALEMGLRVSQMLVRQLMEGMQPMKTDLGEIAMRQRDLQYRVLAFQDLTSLDSEKVQELSVELQISDFTETSDKEDVELNYTVTDTVAEDSVVILTSNTPSESKNLGILRSKLLMSEIQFPDLRESLLGKKVDDVFNHTINNVDHVITLVGIRTAPEPVPEPVAEDTPAPTVLKSVDTKVATENVEA